MLGRASLVAALCWLLLAGSACRHRDVEAGFWFEPIQFESAKLGAPFTPEEIATIASMSSSQVASAFDGLAIRVTDRHDARYTVRVVEQMREGGAGQSRPFGHVAGAGEVNFNFLAAGALHHAPPDADRATVIEAIARGIARTAVHELTHMLLPAAPIHASTNIRSYEYASATRREQYYGPIEWDLARPLLEQRFGRTR